MSNDKKGPERSHAPILIVEPATGDTTAPPSPQDAPPIDSQTTREPARRTRGARLSFATRAFLWLGGATLAAMAAFSLERLVVEATEIAPWVGWAMRGLVLALLLAFAALILRELAGFGRIRRIARIQRTAQTARASGALKDADAALDSLRALYVGRADIGAVAERALRRARENLDGPERLRIFEHEALGPLDDRARREIEQAATQVATVTALAPSVLIDGLAALYVNLRMIRRLAQIYGGRSGALGSLGLARRVVEHAMATGLIALGDDLLEPLMGGGLASKISRRLGEGAVNGAMTARVGLAAMEVCRPLPFDARKRPTLREIAWNALRGGQTAEE